MTEHSFSVIMHVADNARELEQNLSAYLSQEYEPGYEVIVVDESSSDNTDDILKVHKHQYPQLYTTFLPKPNPHQTRRKLALTIGVKAAKYDWVIFTNINTLPSSNGWLHELSFCIDNDTEMVLGYETKKGLRMQLFDDIYEGFRTIEKEERKRSTPHRRCMMKIQRGHYDFVAVPTFRAHMLLSHYEADIKGVHLFGRKVSVFLHNLF